MKRILTIGFFLITGCILTHSELSLQYAFMGLELWFHKMIPTLVPFMILSGIMVRMELTEGFTLFVYPFIKPLFQVSANICYAMIMGFLCGFPMGAKTIADLYSQGLISKREAEYLLAFCNNIGPVYFIGFVIPLLQRKLLLPYLLGMYGLPLLYGLFLRYTYYKDIPLLNASPSQRPNSCKPKQEHGLFLELDNAITQTLQSILSLGGYMIFFNMLNLIPHILFHKPSVYLAPLLEISGGLRLLQDSCPLYVLLLLPFGGLSCIAQTYSCIKNTPLSLANYTLHKLILTALTLGYYLLWFLLFSNSFMR